MIYDELQAFDFVVMAIAMDTPEAARPYIESAKPTYISLIDRDHHVSALFNMVNVPEAVWIDERGHIFGCISRHLASHTIARPEAFVPACVFSGPHALGDRRYYEQVKIEGMP